MTEIKLRALMVPFVAAALVLLLGWLGHSALAAPGSPAASPAFTCTDIPATECDALVALYNQTNGPGWINNTNWLVTSTPCTGWYGVTCDVPGQHVQLLVLSGNLLSGTIPVELGNLPSLQWLFLNNNELSGTIPSALGSLTNLQQLQLGTNLLSGSIPTQLGSLSQLQTLNLSNNALTGTIPAEVANPISLTLLLLQQNQLTGTIPVQIGNRTTLQQLDLSSNQLSGAIPAQLGSLTNLTDLSLFGNQLTGQPPTQLGSLAALQHLYINSNPLTRALPQNFTGLGLAAFWFDITSLCEPPNVGFQNWLGLFSPGTLQRTNVLCAAKAVLLAIGRSVNNAVLTWTDLPPDTDYEVYRSQTPYFTPAAPYLATLPQPTAVYTDTGAIGNVNANYFYIVRAKFHDSANDLSADSNQVAEFSFALVPGQ